MGNFVIVKQYTFNPKVTSNIDFLVKNQHKVFTTKGLNPVQVNIISCKSNRMKIK